MTLLSLRCCCIQLLWRLPLLPLPLLLPCCCLLFLLLCLFLHRELILLPAPPWIVARRLLHPTSLMQLAIDGNHPNMITLLARAGIGIECEDEDGKTLLHRVCAVNPVSSLLDARCIVQCAIVPIVATGSLHILPNTLSLSLSSVLAGLSQSINWQRSLSCGLRQLWLDTTGICRNTGRYTLPVPSGGGWL